MCGRYVITKPVTKTKKYVKSSIKVDDNDNYNAHPYQNLPNKGLYKWQYFRKSKMGDGTYLGKKRNLKH